MVGVQKAYESMSDGSWLHDSHPDRHNNNNNHYILRRSRKKMYLEYQKLSLYLPGLDLEDQVHLRRKSLFKYMTYTHFKIPT